jgi:pyruvate,water dikinase
MARLSLDLVVPITAAAAADAERFGPKAANLARLGHAGLPIPDGFCIDAEAYRLQIAAAGLEDQARRVTSPDPREARCAALAMKLGLLDGSIVPDLLEALLAARRVLVAHAAAPIVVRSSALVEDRFGASFAGQFESYLGLETEEEFLTAVRSCWAALWATRVLRYMATHHANATDTAMAVLVQPLIAARVSGGGLSCTSDGDMVITATEGLGSALAQGEVVPDRIMLSRDGMLRYTAGRVAHSIGCAHGVRSAMHVRAAERCLTTAQAIELGALLRKAEELMGMPVEIEWARDCAGFKVLQARPLHIEAAASAASSDEIWLQHPRLNGHPAGVGRGAGRACVVNCECELSRVAPGDVLVTKVAGPSLSQILPRVAGVIAELGGSTSHLASLARERGIPAVLGVLDATQRIPDGVQVAVDGVAGVVRWMR